MHLHPDSIKRTLDASGLVLPHQQRGAIPDVEAADHSRCSGIQKENPPNRSQVVGTETLQREAVFMSDTCGVLQQVEPAEGVRRTLRDVTLTRNE